MKSHTLHRLTLIVSVVEVRETPIPKTERTRGFTRSSSECHIIGKAASTPRNRRERRNSEYSRTWFPESTIRGTAASWYCRRRSKVHFFAKEQQLPCGFIICSTKEKADSINVESTEGHHILLTLVETRNDTHMRVTQDAFNWSIGGNT